MGHQQILVGEAHLPFAFTSIPVQAHLTNRAYAIVYARIIGPIDMSIKNFFHLCSTFILSASAIADVDSFVNQVSPKISPLPISAEIKKITIVPIFDRRLVVDYVGYTAFGNEVRYIDDVKATDEHLASAVEHELAERGISSQIDWKDRDLLLQTETYPEVSLFGGHPRLRAILDTIGVEFKNNDTNAFLVMIPGGRNFNCPGGEACLAYGSTGYGIQNRQKRRNSAYLSIRMLLIDAKTSEVLRERVLINNRPLSFTNWQPNGNNYSASEQEEVFALLRSEIDESLPTTLDAMGIVKVAP